MPYRYYRIGDRRGGVFYSSYDERKAGKQE